MTFPTPDIGSHRRRAPGKAVEARAAAHRGVAGETFGAQMWFHEDMVNALRGGAQRAGWTGEVTTDGRTVLAITTFGVRHRWVLTGERTECPTMPGTWLYEGIWPD